MGYSAHAAGTAARTITPVLHRGRSGMHQIASPVDDLIWNLMDDLEATAWMKDGRCGEADAEAWFPEKGGSSRPAESVCRGCEVRAECLDYALDRAIPFGIWGGKSTKQRRRIKAAGNRVSTPTASAKEDQA